MNEIKSMDRVASYGEVYTNDSEVKNMVNLVADEAERLESKFLEPACGNGNFLIEVLLRRFNLLKSRYRKNQLDFDIHLFIAVSSIYGIDILEDNIEECQERLLSLCEKNYMKLFNAMEDDLKNTLKFILSKNILCGDAINLTTKNGEPILFTEWSFIGELKVKRREYKFNDLLAYQPSKKNDLFSNLTEEAFIPPCTKEYSPKYYLNLHE